MMVLKDKDGKFNSALLDYVQKGSVELMQSLLRNDYADSVDLDGKTLLHHAAESNNVSMTRHFINNNHDVDIVDNRGNSPLMLAVENGSYDSATMLVEAGANIYLRSGDAASILSNKQNFGSGWPLSNKYHEFVKKVLQKLRKGCCNDEQLLLTRLRDIGCSLIHVISLGDASITRLMVENGYSVGERDFKHNETALHEAVKLRDFGNIKVLLEFGASLGALSKIKYPPLYYLYRKRWDPKAEEEKNAETVQILKILIEHGALLSIQPPDDPMTPVQLILGYGEIGDITVLMLYDIDFNSYYDLYYLIDNENDDVLEVLRGKNIDVNYPNEYSLLSYAVCAGRIKRVQFLLERGADPNAVDDDDLQTPLLNAFDLIDYCPAESVLAIVRLLLQYGADAQYSNDPERESAFELCYNSEEVLKSIVAHLAMIEDRGETISELIRGKIDSRDTYKQHFQVCKNQIEEMKETAINGSVTLYKLLTKSHKVITRYARKPEFATKFEEAMKEKRFWDPYYSISLHKRVGKAIHEAKLKEEALIVLKKIFHCHLRNYTDIFDEFLGYLTCDDLKNICKVYDLPVSESFNLNPLYV